MARLTRKNQKIFAENATNNGVFGSLQAGNPITTNDVEQIQSLPAYSQGWNAATMASELLPPLEEFQAIQYMITRQMSYFFQEGIPEWGADVTFYEGSLTKQNIAGGMRVYSSKTNENKGNQLDDSINWQKVFDTSDPYAFTTWVNQQLELKEDLSNKVDTLSGANTTTYPTTNIVKKTIDDLNTSLTKSLTDAINLLTQQINLRQLTSNIAQNLNSPTSTTYPSTNAVKNEISRIIDVMDSNCMRYGSIQQTITSGFVAPKNGYIGGSVLNHDQQGGAIKINGVVIATTFNRYRSKRPFYYPIIKNQTITFEGFEAIYVYFSSY